MQSENNTVKTKDTHEILRERAKKANEMSYSWLCFLAETLVNTKKLYGLTARELVKLLNISESTYYKLRTVPTEKLSHSTKDCLFLMRFCYIFGLDMQTITKPAEIYGNDELLELGTWIGSLPRQDLHDILLAVNESPCIPNESKKKFSMAITGFLNSK